MKVGKHILILSLFLALSGCTSLRRAYPLAGATVGGGIGAMAGPGPAALGAGAGYVGGEFIKSDLDARDAIENAQAAQQEAEETLRQLTMGDVEGVAQKLIQQRLAEAQESWGDKILKEIWGWTKLALVLGGFILFFILILLPFLHKRGIKLVEGKLLKEFKEKFVEKK